MFGFYIYCLFSINSGIIASLPTVCVMNWIIKPVEFQNWLDLHCFHCYSDVPHISVFLYSDFSVMIYLFPYTYELPFKFVTVLSKWHTYLFLFFKVQICYFNTFWFYLSFSLVIPSVLRFNFSFINIAYTYDIVYLVAYIIITVFVSPFLLLSLAYHSMSFAPSLFLYSHTWHY